MIVRAFFFFLPPFERDLVMEAPEVSQKFLSGPQRTVHCAFFFPQTKQKKKEEKKKTVTVTLHHTMQITTDVHSIQCLRHVYIF